MKFRCTIYNGGGSLATNVLYRIKGFRLDFLDVKLFFFLQVLPDISCSFYPFYLKSVLDNFRDLQDLPHQLQRCKCGDYKLK